MATPHGGRFTLTDFGFGPESRDRTEDSRSTGHDGAIAALETFYFALNTRDDDVMRSVWSPHELAQLNNPVGGIIRGGGDAADLYRAVFASGLRLSVTFGDAATYLLPGAAIFAGRETGTYGYGDSPDRPLEIRTSRCFAHDTDLGRWVQVHHHGSIDDPAALAAYQQTVRRGRHD